MTNLFKKQQSHVDSARVMESRDHSKLLSVTEVNGVSPKNQRSRGNFLMLGMALKEIEALGEETYNVLKNDFDARRIMGEMNYIIDQINEYWEQNEYFRESYKWKKNYIDNPPNIPMYFIMRKINPVFNEKYKKIKEEAELFKNTKKKLDDYIKAEWNPRIRILRENSKNYYSDKELRDGYNQFVDVDKEIQKLTIEGEKAQQINKFLKVAGIGLIAATGLALGAVGAANRAADRQSFRDNFGA